MIKHRQSWVSLYSTQPTFGLEAISNTKHPVACAEARHAIVDLRPAIHPKPLGQFRQALVQRPQFCAGRDQNRGQQLQID